MNLVRYFRQFWPHDHGRFVLGAQYGELKRLELVLTDIGLRAGLWSVTPTVRDLYEAGRMAGRREVALEIFKIVNADPRLLFGNVTAKSGS